MPDIDASTSNAYTTSAFRQPHLMLDDLIFLDQKGRDSSRRNTTGVCKSDVNSISCISAPTMTLAEALQGADMLFGCDNSLDSLIMGTIKKPAQISNDMRVATTIRDLGEGRDLISIDIERGRDHGLPPYTAWRRFCDLPSFTFKNNSNTHSSKILEKLQKVYK